MATSSLKSDHDVHWSSPSFTSSCHLLDHWQRADGVVWRQSWTCKHMSAFAPIPTPAKSQEHWRTEFPMLRISRRTTFRYFSELKRSTLMNSSRAPGNGREFCCVCGGYNLISLHADVSVIECQEYPLLEGRPFLQPVLYMVLPGVSSLLVDPWSRHLFCLLPRRMTAKLSPSDKVDDIMGIFELFDNDATGSLSGGVQMQSSVLLAWMTCKSRVTLTPEVRSIWV